jgi:ubiquinone/menaquinone biosynthesis C-methylase UbiE
MVNVANSLLDRAFGHPRGPLGLLGGKLMERGNRDQERRAVDQASLREGERVLVVGHGPGVGVSFAAAAVGRAGHVVGVDPSGTVRRIAGNRCAAEIRDHVVELRAGTAERTGCEDGGVDAAISVNNVMLWDLTAGLAEMRRVLRPGGRFVVSVHRHVLGMDPEELADRARRAGLERVALTLRPRRLVGPAVELLARNPAA